MHQNGRLHITKSAPVVCAPRWRLYLGGGTTEGAESGCEDGARGADVNTTSPGCTGTEILLTSAQTTSHTALHRGLWARIANLLLFLKIIYKLVSNFVIYKIRLNCYNGG